MKKPIAIIFNDAHLKTGNEQNVITSVDHMLDYACDNDIRNIIFAGDLFDSRSFQRQDVLQAFDIILNNIHRAKCTLYLFPGNHDKTVYSSEDSFLDVFRHHPCVKFNRTIKDIEIDGVKITLLPFFSDEVLIPIIEEHGGSDVLISHFEMAGSTNLGKESKKTSINEKLLSKWKKVYLGHYHNHHEISKNIVHLPSLRQNNFGEDNKKGFAILFDDLSYELIKGKFKEFKKITLDLDKLSTKEIKELIQENKDNKDSIRFEFKGSDEKLNSLDKVLFADTGIDVKLKFKEKDLDKENAPQVVRKFDKTKIMEFFEDFCKEKKLDHKKGEELLNEFLNKDMDGKKTK